MVPLNWLMNHVSELTHSNSFFKRHVGARISTIAAGIPLECLASLHNLIKLPFDAVLMVVKVPAKAINLCIGSQTFREFEASLPGPWDLFKTAVKIFAYAIGTFFTATLGFLSPYANFRLHTMCGLVVDEKAKTAKWQAEVESHRLRDAQEKAMQSHIANLVMAMRQKIAEKERILTEEANKRKEAEEINSIKEEEEQQAIEFQNQQDLRDAEEARLRIAVEKAVARRLEEDSKRAKLVEVKTPAAAPPPVVVDIPPTKPIEAPKTQSNESRLESFLPSWLKNLAKVN